MSIKVITFDFWGTLYRNKVSLNEERKNRILNRLIDSGFSKITSQMVLSAMKKVWSHWDVVWRNEKRTLDVNQWLDLVFVELNVSPSYEVHKEIVEDLQQAIFSCNTRPVEFVKEAINNLKVNYKLGIISDTGIASGISLRKLLKRDSLDCFDLYIFSDEFGKSKPSEELFSAVLSYFTVNPEEVIHIGDLLHTDVKGAREAGMHSVRFTGVRDNKNTDLEDANYIINDYRDLAAIVEGIV